jgi:hypothetical protein
MTNHISRAVTGDENAAGLLRSVGISFLQSHAGHLPPKTKEKPKKATLKVVKESEDLQWELDLLRTASSVTFADYSASENYYKAHHLKPLMPLTPILRMNKPLYEVWRWVDGRAWIAGSAALWCVDPTPNPKWLYGDIDIFCRSVDSYNELVEELREIGYVPTINGQYSTKFSYTIFNTQKLKYSLNLNRANQISLISPVEKDWSTVESLLLGFDISASAVAIADPSNAYAYDPDHLKMRWVQSFISLEYPLRTFSRILKYLHRGYSFSYHSMWQLVADGRLSREFEALRIANEYTKSEEIKSLTNLYFEVARDYEDSQSPDYEPDEEDYYEEDYPYS